jgi:hypothetical protein
LVFYSKEAKEPSFVINAMEAKITYYLVALVSEED